MSIVLVLDESQATKTFPIGYYLVSIDYPAVWTPEKDQATRFIDDEVDHIEKSWDYIRKCSRVETDDILRVSIK